MAGKRTAAIPFLRARRVVTVTSVALVMLTTPTVASFTGAASAATTCQVNPGAGSSWTTADIAKAKDGHALANSIRDMGAWKFYANGIFGQYRYGGPIDIALIDSGVNPVRGLDTGNVVQGPDLSFESQNPALAHFDTLGHGTMMASLMVGRDVADPSYTDVQNPLKFLGVAPKARVVSVKVADSQGAVDVTQVIAGIDWVVAHAHDPISAKNPTGFNIKVINLSYGVVANDAPDKDALSYAVEQAWRAGIAVVVAAGNGGASTGKFSPGLTSPAYNPDVIAVGSYDDNGTVKTFDANGKVMSANDDFMPPYTSGASSSNKRTPDFVAPAQHITGLHSIGAAMDDEIHNACLQSSSPSTYPITVFGPSDRFLHGSGTSQAAALASGAVALLMSQYPGYTNDEVKHALATTAYGFGAGTNLSGAGSINLTKAFSTPATLFTQSIKNIPGGGTLVDARGSSVLSAMPVSPAVCSPACALTGDKNIFGNPLITGFSGLASAEATKAYGTIPITPWAWQTAPGGAYQTWMGAPMLGNGFVTDSYMPPDAYGKPTLVWAGYPWLKNFAGLDFPTDTEHSWSTALQRFSLTTTSWQRFSLTGQDWSSHTLRDNGWS
jgi:serine protease AprX